MNGGHIVVTIMHGNCHVPASRKKCMEVAICSSSNSNFLHFKLLSEHAEVRKKNSYPALPLTLEAENWTQPYLYVFIQRKSGDNTNVSFSRHWEP